MIQRVSERFAARLGGERTLRRRLLRMASFALGALFNAGVHFSVMALAILGFGWAPVLASSVGAVLGTLCAFAFNHLFTFADIDGAWHRRGPTWLAIAAALWFVNGLVLDGALRAGLPVIPGQLLASLVCLIVSYLLNHRFTFGAHRG